MTGGEPTVTIVHERFTEFAGSEQVVAQLAQQWPDAEIVAPIGHPEVMPKAVRDRIRTTRLSRLLRGDGYAHLLPLLPFAMRHLDLGTPDVVVASHHAFADQVVHATEVPVIAYVHRPARWVWDPAMRSGEMGGAAGALALGAFAAGYRPLDRRAATRLSRIVANSSAVAGRVRDWWGRDAEVIHPPVDTEFFTPDPSVAREDFFLLAGRLVPYKQPAVAIRAATAAGVRLLVAGDGRQRAECEALAGPNVTFLGRVSDDELRDLFRRARAVLMPGIEDFGIVPVEAQACGTPVLATAAGGALDSVQPGTGVLVNPDEHYRDPLYKAWTTALRDFDDDRFTPETIRTHAERFSRARFRAAMAAIVQNPAGGSTQH